MARQQRIAGTITMKTIKKTKVTLTSKSGADARLGEYQKVHYVPIDKDPLDLADCSTIAYDTETVTKHYCGKTSGPALVITHVLQDFQEKFLTIEEAQDILLNEVAIPFNQMKTELSNIAFNKDLQKS